MLLFDARAFVRQLTTAPGVYRMIGADETILYIGKAKNLQKRVSSYFIQAGNAKTVALVAQIARIEVTVTHTEDEALMLEATLIKQHQPRYNILLKDDKSYPYVLFTQHEFPRLLFHRGAQREVGTYFGPYPSRLAVGETIELLHKIFKIRACEDSQLQRKRACLQHQIGRCSAPCVGNIDTQNYQQNIQDAQNLLRGNGENLVKNMESRMISAAENLEFEIAARIRDQITALRRLQEQTPARQQGDVDVACVLTTHGLTGVLMMSVRNGKMVGQNSFFPKIPAQLIQQIHQAKNHHNLFFFEVLNAFLPQYYLQRPIPDRILLANFLEIKAKTPEIQREIQHEISWLAEGLSQHATRSVKILTQMGGLRQRWAKMAHATLEQILGSKLASLDQQNLRLANFQQIFNLNNTPKKIECFDISHTMGEGTVASCVVFEGALPAKNQYRRFNIENITGGDDYAAMHQAVLRRFTRLHNENNTLPDVLLIDGGENQLAKAIQALEESGAPWRENTFVIAVAKGEARKAGEEQLFVYGETAPRRLSPTEPALHLIQHIRDESHRFALIGHRARRAKARQGEKIESIAGLGAKRKQNLLRHFGGIQGVARAGVAELAQVDNISPALAQKIYDFFRN